MNMMLNEYLIQHNITHTHTQQQQQQQALT